MKTCTKCRREQPLTDFHLDKKSQDGHSAQCKECRRARYRVRQEPIDREAVARQAALELLAEAHPTHFERLLRAARVREGILTFVWTRESA